MTTTLEQVAKAIYDLDPAQGQDHDLDFQPVGQVYLVPFEELLDFDEGLYHYVMEQAGVAVKALKSPSSALSLHWDRMEIDGVYTAPEEFWDAGLDFILNEECSK